MNRPLSGYIARVLPGVALLANYRRAWLARDLYAGIALSAVLVPVGMSYAQAAGLPAITGLHASVAALLAYALLGPSRILVLGPDSALAALIAGAIVPLAGHDPPRAIALAGALALSAGTICILLGVLDLGFVTDLLSRPIQYGYLNGIAIALALGRLPELLGMPVSAGDVFSSVPHIVHALAGGRFSVAAGLLGVAVLATIILFKQVAPRWPGVLIAVLAATIVARLPPLHGIPTVGALPAGLPAPRLPAVSLADLSALASGAVAVALVSFADISMLSRALSARAGDAPNRNQELIALGAANLLAGMTQGCAVSSSASRTPVAIAAGAQSQITNLVAAACITILLVAAPALLIFVPRTALAAVVIYAAFGIADVRSVVRLYRMRRGECLISMLCFAGVIGMGVVPGILLASALSLLSFVWRAWHPYDAVLGRLTGVRGYHDIARHPGAAQTSGLVLFRWDAPLFYANVEIFCEHLRAAIARSTKPVTRIVVAAEPVTDIDVSAADRLVALHAELAERGIAMNFAEMKGPVKDRLRAYGLFDVFGAASFFPTVTDAVARHVRRPGRQTRPCKRKRATRRRVSHETR
ncbi:SulP family inorganic anion transporter [Burkholderia cenocepacia]|uniref:Sulfate transporter family protein n=1 Tax=Burkholderia cenocepacia (strain ATCC BAA-245 / DSM 16553 / LMG 16656 / NCTC 13227 / J2315 / CF5610) TaxID=216591 RepID=B4EI93_BURCJ|nr:SulP family inorganic anion transporter [Burkholderia cenocepacia]KIS52747.1 sulfate transporter family protein [Burkholderia cepacia]EPZ89641.1 inorganic anion transporter, SulP family [Burkholderia cenocepacia K56-2Valvano]ERI29542.1 inorganic anion transporter, SulP family [Burkholderia cenocepacia BC7]KKI80627.1 transporter [Burkholderia cenocepacia]ONX65858.1 sodium-independent anion transporter [Burkholderia cenocepacia]